MTLHGVDDTRKFASDEGINKLYVFLRKYMSLKDEEERDLFKQYREDGDMKARDKIILCNQRFIYSIAKTYTRDTEELFDYINEGTIGLMDAMDSYDYHSGFRFLTYAVWYIRRNMLQFMLNQRDTIRKSNNFKFYKKVDVIVDTFFAQNGYLPSADIIKDQMKERFGMKVLDDKDVWNVVIASIDSNVTDDTTVEDSNEYIVTTSSVNEYNEVSERDYVKSLVATMLRLIPRDYQQLVKKFYGVGYSRPVPLTELSMEYKLPENEVKKLVENACKYIKQEASSKGLVQKDGTFNFEKIKTN